MAVIKIKRGQDLRIAGRPLPVVAETPRPARVALQPSDFRYLRPRLKVREGAAVRVGTPLFESKDDPRVVFVSPASGRVAAVRLGERRRVLEVVVELSETEDFEPSPAMSADDARGLERGEVVERLLAGGLWPLLRQRPFSRIADPDGEPKAVFIGAMSAEPFAPDPDALLEGREDEFQLGLDILGKLTAGEVHLCVAAEAKSAALTKARGVRIHRFAGPHPAGNVAVQIYHVDPPRGTDTVLYTGAQEVLAIARSFTTGRFSTERVVSFCGPGAKEPRYLRTRVGASIDSLARGGVQEGELRFVSGGVLTGRQVEPSGFLGFYDTTLFVLREGRRRELLSFILPGFDKYSLSRALLSSWLPPGDHSVDTNLQGGVRHFLMNGVYEDVCPVDIIPDQLAKAVLADDVEEAEKHGILDCAECGLCTFVCPSKIEIGSIIRRGLDEIVKEG
ncbi:MAG: Na(+)-translocating NADH-quinone reductase subunit A [Elusimicrobiota bacterium]